MKHTTEEYSDLLNGRLPCSDLEIELCDRLIEANKTELNLHSGSNRLIVDDNHNYEYDGVAPITIQAVSAKSGLSVKQLGVGCITIKTY